MNTRAKKTILLLLAAVLLFASGQLQKSLNQDRDKLGLTYATPLQDAPPVLALFTQALGGFRGLISNFLWMRANDLQINDKYFEAAQLANWITDLEPHFAQVWVYEGWNMAYNISVKFTDFGDRWRWVENGIELLRDRGLLYNPDSTLIYRELGWFFQHKMGQNLDDANVYYKTAWAKEMTPFFGPHGTNIDNLVNPQNAEDRTNAFILSTKYKINPAFAKKVNEEWGPLDWRLPEAHAIYWASVGLDQAAKHPNNVKPEDLIQLRRVVYQSMLQTFDHGAIIDNPFVKEIEMGPNVPLIPKVNDAYEAFMKDDTNNAQHIAVAHRNFLADAAYFQYEQNNIPEAQKWYKLLSQLYPDKTLLDNDPNSYPRNLTLDDFAVGRVNQDFHDTSQNNTTAAIEGLLIRAYEAMALGDEDRYTGLTLLARKVYNRYQDQAGKYEKSFNRTKLPPFKDLNQVVLDHILDPQSGLPYAARAVIRTQLKMPPEGKASSASASTNSVPMSISSPTNAPSTNSVAP
ncbi:MAG TPA: hypothetical protein VMH87_13885 [Pseudomonadales bacterium]|nr:hypothetical protein [Pseudomonadales bacterium]